MRPPMEAMTAWMTGESARKVPLGRPKPAEAAALPCATVALAALAPSIRLNATRFPPMSHTATLILTLISCALAIAARIASLKQRGPESAMGYRDTPTACHQESLRLSCAQPHM